MENKKIKLTLSGIAKKSIENIELAKTQSKNSVVIEKKQNKFTNKGNFNKPAGIRAKKSTTSPGNYSSRLTNTPKPS